MPNLKDIFKEEPKQINSTFEELPGLRPCSKCELDVDGGLWDPVSLVMKWTCSDGHETVHKVG